MQYVPFGRTGMTVSRIGFGASRIGGVFAGADSTSQALNLLRRALDQGITFYDTADMYAQGESEALIGRAFQQRRSEVVIATKGGYCLPARRNLIRRVKPLLRPLVRALGLKRARLPAGMSGALSQNFSPQYLTGALHASLRRLRTDHVDLYQLHSPDAAFMQTPAFTEALDVLERLREQGKLRFYGVATEIPEDAPFCLSAPGIASVQLGFGLLDLQAVEQGTLAAAQARGLAVIARGCFGGGLLKEGPDAAQLQALTPKWQRILALREFSQHRERPLLDLALQFCLGNPAVTVALLGMHAERHLASGLGHLAAPALEPQDVEALVDLGRTQA